MKTQIDALDDALMRVSTMSGGGSVGDLIEAAANVVTEYRKQEIEPSTTERWQALARDILDKTPESTERLRQSLERGLEDSAAGRVTDLGSFAEHVAPTRVVDFGIPNITDEEVADFNAALTKVQGKEPVEMAPADEWRVMTSENTEWLSGYPSETGAKTAAHWLQGSYVQRRYVAVEGDAEAWVLVP